jgi:hypothetical protein
MEDAKRGFVLLVLVAVVGVIATACGGGSSTSGSQTSQPSQTSQAPQPAQPAQPVQPSQRTSFSSYEIAMQVLGDRLASALATTGRAIAAPNPRPAVIEQDLLTAQRQLRGAAVTLEKITPPAKIKALHELLIRSVREFADELDNVIAGVNKKNGAPVVSVIPALKGVKDMQRASDAILKAGYVIVVQAR